MPLPRKDQTGSHHHHHHNNNNIISSAKHETYKRAEGKKAKSAAMQAWLGETGEDGHWNSEARMHQAIDAKPKSKV